VVRVAINGFGRIGRGVFRAWLERNQVIPGGELPLQIVAVNDLHDVTSAAHLLEYDSTHGRFNGPIASDRGCLQVDGRSTQWLQEPDPRRLPWAELNIDLVLECSGRFASAVDASAHLEAGASKVLISAPAKGVDRTVVYGVNHQLLKGDETLLSNASCTTNCLAIIAQLLHEAVGVAHGMVTTVHCYTNDQSLQDRFHPDLRRARAVGPSIIPTTTGVVDAVSEVLPEMAGKLEGFSIRVPTQNVSLLDFTFTADQATNVEQINQLFREAASDSLAGLLSVSDAPLVSIDFNHRRESAVIDVSLTRVSGGKLVKVCAWYDNEWGFANRMLDVAMAAFKTSGRQTING
jgi:glyceraldehyde 3-phosphate dehydrogenase